MIEERIEVRLRGMGYVRRNSNVPWIYLYQRGEDTELSVVSVIRCSKENVLSKEQYEYLLSQLKGNLQSAYPQPIRLLSLILTADSSRDKHLCIENIQDSHWLIDLTYHRLMIYETQSSEFSELRSHIEELLAQEELSREDNHTERHYEGHYEGSTINSAMADTPSYSNESKKGNLIHTLKNNLSPVNTGILLLNVIIFLFMQFAPVPGGEHRILAEGALSWYYITDHKEYYRLLSAMFMHADFSHLGNNMLVLFCVGDKLERVLGKLKFLFIYFSAGILAGITSISYNMWKEQGHFTENSVYSIGASGAIFGLIGAMLYIVLRSRGRMRNISSRQMMFFVLFSLYGGIANAQIDQAAHVGGFLAGFAAAALVYRHKRRLVNES